MLAEVTSVLTRQERAALMLLSHEMAQGDASCLLSPLPVRVRFYVARASRWSHNQNTHAWVHVYRRERKSSAKPYQQIRDSKPHH